ncbi:transcriptional regulator TACO1-like protein [Panaeolus papilionaceus]|nr:transcriptional regulator TACO1-like protein [Panaeolus papilionaceus]
MNKLVSRSLPHASRLSFVCRRALSTSSTCFAGHNKWSKIKDKKGANDAQKSVLYARANHDISVAVRLGGSADPSKNMQLAAALKKAKEQGVPKENIEKALARATGAKDKVGDSVMYEALVDDVGIIVECATDNVNRTIHNIREILTLHNARMSSVKFMFEHKGCITVLLPEEEKDASAYLDRLLEEALSWGIEDMVETSDPERYEVR